MVILFWPSANKTSELKAPDEIAAGTPFTVTVARLSSILPETIINCADDMDPFWGDAMVTAGGCVSNVTEAVVGYDQFPALSFAFA